MQSFGSSVINKSSKKLAPKAPKTRKPLQNSVPPDQTSINVTLDDAEDDDGTFQDVADSDAPRDLTAQRTSQILGSSAEHAAENAPRRTRRQTASQQDNERHENPHSALEDAVQPGESAEPRDAEQNSAALAASGGDSHERSKQLTPSQASSTQRRRGQRSEPKPTPGIDDPDGSNSHQESRGVKSKALGITTMPKETQVQPPSKRPRGRPPKSRQTLSNALGDNDALNVASETQPMSTTTPQGEKSVTSRVTSYRQRSLQANAFAGDQSPDVEQALLTKTAVGHEANSHIGRKTKLPNNEKASSPSSNEVRGANDNMEQRLVEALGSLRDGRGSSAQPVASIEHPTPATEQAVESSSAQVNENGNTSDSGVPKRKKRKRAATPEDAERHQIDPKTMTMFDLCRDRKIGKKSKLEAEMQTIDWSEVGRRRKEAQARAIAAGVKASDTTRQQLEDVVPTTSTSGPQLRLRNGEIVLDSSSLVVNRHALPEQQEPAIEESDLTRRINSQSWLFDNRRDPEDRFFRKSDRWTPEDTEIFFGALKMFGTDFDMISKIFPGRTRRMIKHKFVREERQNESRIRAVLLGEPDLLDMETYCELTGRTEEEYKDPELLAQELKEEEELQRARIEHEREEQAEQAKKKQEAAQAKADAANRRKAGEKVPRRKRKKRDAEGAEATGSAETAIQAGESAPEAPTVDSVAGPDVPIPSVEAAV